tara:strand:- start:266 stop:745 length:480 start_codon:yes stop_codon:yes gene_type:complete
MLDIFLYRLIVKDYIPSVYDMFPDFFQESLFTIPDQENANINNYTTYDKFNPIKRIADSKYGKIITLSLMILITIYSVYISYKCNGPGKSMYMTFSFLFPITHFFLLKFPKLLPDKVGNIIGCDYEKIKKSQKTMETIKLATENMQGGKGSKYKRKKYK